MHGTRLNVVQSRIPGLNLVLALIHWGADIVQNYWQDVARTGCSLNARMKCKDEEQEKQEWLPQNASVHPSISHCEQPCVCPSVLYLCQIQQLLVTFPYHIPALKSAPLFSTQEYNCQLKICENSLIRKELKLKLNIKKWEGEMVWCGSHWYISHAFPADWALCSSKDRDTWGNLNFQFPPFPTKILWRRKLEVNVPVFHLWGGAAVLCSGCEPSILPLF